jgi:hypothetical protein
MDVVSKLFEKLDVYKEEFLEKKSVSKVEKLFAASVKKYYIKNFPYQTDVSKSGNIIISELNSNLMIAMLNASLVAMLSRVKNSKVIFIGDIYKRSPQAFRFLRRAFCVCDFTSFREQTKGLERKIEEEALKLYKGITTKEDLLIFKYKGVQVGDLLYDQSMRRGLPKASLWKIDQSVLIELEHMLRTYYSLENLKKEYIINSIVTSDYIGTEYGCAMRFLSSEKIPSYSGSGGTFMIKKYSSYSNGRFAPPYELPKNIAEKIIESRKDETLIQANKYLNNKLKGNVKNLDAKAAFNSELLQYEKKEYFCSAYGLDPTKPVFVVMLHSFNDACNHFENMLYNDYYSWFMDTLDIVKDLTDSNWIFKEHPACKFYPHDANLQGIFELLKDQKHVVFLDNEDQLNTSTILKHSQAILTCHGTIALEAGSQGIPSLQISDSYYSSWGIGKQCMSRDEYRMELKNIIALPRLTEDQMDLAKIILYLTEKVVCSEFTYEVFPFLSRSEQRNPNKEKMFKSYLAALTTDRYVQYDKILESYLSSSEKEVPLNTIDYPWLKDYDVPN